MIRNRLHLWGSAGVEQTRYSNIVSFMCDEIMLKVYFDDFSHYLGAYDNDVAVTDIIRDDNGTKIIKNILEALQRNNKETCLTIDVTDRWYQKLMSFFVTELVGPSYTDVKKSLSYFDTVFDNLDKDIVCRFPVLSEAEFLIVKDAFCNNSNKEEFLSINDLIRRNSDELDYKKLVSSGRYDESFLYETYFILWSHNHLKQFSKNDVYSIKIYSNVMERVKEGLMYVKREERSTDYPEFNVMMAEDSEINKVVVKFFSLVSHVIFTTLEGPHLYNKEVEQNYILNKNDIFVKIWSSFVKENSLWMVSPYSYSVVSSFIGLEP